MLFYSPHAAYRVICTPTRFKRHPTTGDIIETIPSITCEFGKSGPEYSFMNPETGETMTGASIVGHYFDTDEEALQHGWDDDSKAMVERKLLALAARQPEDLQYEERNVTVPAPWPTYDDLPAEKVADMAITLGLAAEALAYERQGSDRPVITEPLEAHLNADTTDDPGVEPVKPVAKARPEPVPVGGATITL